MTVWQSSGRQNYHIAFLNIHGSPGQFLSAFCPQISSKLILTAAESQSSPPFVCIVLSYCCISSITIPLFFGAWLLPVACCTWARRVLPFWWDLTRLLLLLLSSGWWRRYINKLVGTKEARVPCTSGNTQCHSSVRWTSMYSFLVSQITIFIPIFCSQIVFLNCCSEQLEMAFLILNLVIHLHSNPIFVLQYDPFAEHRPQKIAEREDEYKARRRQMIISPERLDPFADGKLCYFLFSLHLPHFLPLFMVHFCDPHDCQWFYTHSFAVQPFDHNAIACLPDFDAFPVVNPVRS